MSNQMIMPRAMVKKERQLAKDLYEASEYFASLQRGVYVDWPKVLQCQTKVINARKAYEEYWHSKGS